MNKGMTFLQHAILIIFVDFTEVINEEDGKDNHHQNKHDRHNSDMILFFD